MNDAEPDLIAWLRQQIERDIRVMSQALEGKHHRTILGKKLPERVDAQERLPNRRYMLRLLDEHKHDRHLGCRTCHAATVRLYPLRVCATVQLTAVMFRTRPGYLVEWRTSVEQIMASPAP